MIGYLRLVRQFALVLFALGFLGLVALSLPMFLKWSLVAIIAAAWVAVRALLAGHNKPPQRSRPDENFVVMSEPASKLASEHEPVPLRYSVYLQALTAFLEERELWIENSRRIVSMSDASGTAGGG